MLFMQSAMASQRQRSLVHQQQQLLQQQHQLLQGLSTPELVEQARIREVEVEKVKPTLWQRLKNLFSPG